MSEAWSMIGMAEKLLEKKKAGLVAKPDAEAKARPPRRARATAACDLVRLDPF